MKHKKLSPTELKKNSSHRVKKKKDFHLKCTNKILSLLKSPPPSTFLMPITKMEKNIPCAVFNQICQI